MPTRLVDRATPRRFLTGLSAVAVGTVSVLVLLADNGRRLVIDALDTVDAELVPLFALSGAAVVLGGLVVRRHVRLSLGQAAIAVACALMTMVGLGVAAAQNGLNSFPTARPGARALAERAALDNNGDLSAKWPFFERLGQLVTADVFVPDGTWLPWLQEVAEVPVMIDSTYNPILPDGDVRLEGEWLFDVAVDDTQHFIIIGKGTNYRLHTWGPHIVFLGEAP